jgi:putative ABC transport system permease protein
LLKNYFIAAIRNLIRDRAYAAINLFGLALGFAAVILIGLYVRDELSYDRAYPHSERIFRVVTEIKGANRQYLAVSDARFARALELDFPQVETTTRLKAWGGTLRQHNTEVATFFVRAAPNFFRVFPPKIVAGDAAALERPGMLVITRRFAHQLFGRENVVGEPVELNRQQTLRIGAVIENLPSNTHFGFDAIASTSNDDLDKLGNVYTYVRLRRGADAQSLNAGMQGFVQRHVTERVGAEPAWKNLAVRLVALPDLHFLPPSIGDMKTPSDRRTVDALIVIGLVILVVAGSNFVSMMTARCARRAIEVGVRKAVGATRRQIIIQFLGECFFYVGLALGIAVGAVELVLPGFNGFLQRSIAFDFMRDPTLGFGLVAACVAVAGAAGVYPALVLSMFRPVTVLKGTLSLPGGPGRLRTAMVVLQFATLVTLIVSTATIYRQTRFAIEDQLRVPGDQLFVMQTSCLAGFRDIALRIPGVREAACTDNSALGTDSSGSAFALKAGGSVNLNVTHVDTTFFQMFAVTPVAGRLFDERHGEDTLLVSDGTATANPSIILNESAARVLGYASPRDAVGTTRYWQRGELQDTQFRALEMSGSPVVGIVPDFTVGSIRNTIEPTAYYVDPGMSFTLILKLDGNSIPETMPTLEAAWTKATAGSPFAGQFMSQIISDRYADIQRQTRLFSAFSGVAIFIASLGLLGLAVFTAERRTREIGLRKVMGASRSDILRFIGWQFARPVLLANVLAWPCAWFFMRRWLEGFAYHVNLAPLVFVVASVLALLIALATVSSHAWQVARAKPAQALRYE